MRKHLQLLPLRLTLLALLGCPLFFQANQGSLSGTVKDQTGGSVPGADVTVTNQGTNAAQLLVTTDRGNFHATKLAPGLYKVQVVVPGFNTHVARDVKVNVGEEHSLSVSLEVGDVSSVVMVTAGVDLVNTADASVSTTVQTRQIQDLPLQARNPLNLIKMQAGTAANGNVPTSIVGLRPTYTNMTLDGINIQDNFIRENPTTFTPTRLTQSMVSEFTLTSVNQGSVSGFGASQVSFVSPAGTNDLHGEVYWVHRNNATKANEFFNNLSGVDKPFLLRNQFGVTANGPLVKDRLFWYANYEGFRERAQSDFLALVLSQKARQGIYQYEAADGSGLQEIDLLPLCSATADSFMADQIAQTPLGNDSTRGDGFNTLGYRYNLPSNEDRDQFGFRLDFILNDSHSFEGVYRYNDLVNQRPDFLSGFEETFSRTISKPDFVSTAWHWTAGPSFINEVRFGGTFSNVVFTDERDFLRERGFKVVAASYTDPEGDGDMERQGRDTNTWNYADNASWTRGDHSFRFGFQGQNIRNLSFAAFNVVPTYGIGANFSNGFELGTEEFPGGAGQTDADRATGILTDLAGMLNDATGEFHVRSRTNPAFIAAEEAFNWENDIYAFYFGDTWRVSPGVTLTGGVRWEWYRNLRERDDLITQPVIGSDGARAAVLDENNVVDFQDGNITHNDLNNFAPNIGIAWDLFGNGRTALRACYGIAYANDHMVTNLRNALNRYGVTSFVQLASLGSLTETISNRPPIPVPEFKLPLSWPDINNPASPNFVEDFPAAFVVDPNLVAPYAQTWQVGVTHEVGWNTALEFRWAGSKGTKLVRAVDFNQVDIRGTGFLDDVKRAQSNGEIAEAAGLGYDPAHNPDLDGSQVLPVFDALFGGALFIPFIRDFVRTGEAGLLLSDIYAFNFFCVEVQCHPNSQVLVGDVVGNGGDSIYHSFQVEARRRFSAGLTFNANYTFGKVLSNQVENGQASFEPHLDDANPGYDRGRTAFDVTHVFNTNFTWELPVGQGRRVDISNSVANQILGGWDMTSIFNIQSGEPFSFFSHRGTVNRFGRSFGRNRANSTLGNSGIRDSLGIGSDDRGPFFFPTDAPHDDRLSHPGAGELGGLPRFGFNGPGQFSWDLGVIKKFPVKEDLAIEFRGEFFNLTNTTNFNTGNAEDQRSGTLDIESGSFGRLQLTNTEARIIQFSLKVIF